MVCLHLKKSKTDPFHQGIDIYVGATGSDVCPVNALLQYIGVRSSTAGPPFIFHTFRELNSRLAWNTRTSMATVFVSEQLLRQLSVAQKTLSFKHWVGGRVMHTKYTSRSPLAVGINFKGYIAELTPHSLLDLLPQALAKERIYRLT